MWGMTFDDRWIVARIKFRRRPIMACTRRQRLIQHWIQYPGIMAFRLGGSLRSGSTRYNRELHDIANYNRLVPRETADKQLEGKSVGWPMRRFAPQERAANLRYRCYAGWRMKIPQRSVMQGAPYWGGLARDNSQRQKPFGTDRMARLEIMGPWVFRQTSLYDWHADNGGSVVTAGA